VPLQELRAREQKLAYQQGAGPLKDALARLKDPVKKLGEAEHAGLPLETGLAARQLLETLSGLRSELAAPLRMILDALRPKLEEWATPPGVEKKSEIVLDRQELERELGLVEHYLETENPARALRLLREWLINLVLDRTGQGSAWLDYGAARKPAEHRLALVEARKGGLPSALADLASVWSAVSQLRNGVAHAAFKREDVGPTVGKVRGLMNGCRSLLNGDLDFRVLGDGDHLLVTPLGLSPGVLYTALHELEPDRVLVLTSPAAHPGLAEAVDRAGFGGDLEVVEVGDPHVGYEEANAILQEKDGVLMQTFMGCGEATINMTGGTTLLGWMAGEVARRAERTIAVVRRVALVDRRPPEAQRADPWVCGTVVALDRTGDDDGGDEPDRVDGGPAET